MICRVRLANFKRFRSQTFELNEATVLAGPNDSGNDCRRSPFRGTLWTYGSRNAMRRLAWSCAPASASIALAATPCRSET